jgi:uncharacterized protein (DUF1330 family)
MGRMCRKGWRPSIQDLVRSNKIQALEGEPPKGGGVVIAFDSAEKAHEWYDAPAYAAIPPIPAKRCQESPVYRRGYHSQMTGQVR